MNTDKLHIRHLAKICATKGMKYVVLSPGSRCAPLVIAFNRQEGIECISIVDERSAAFFALGLAQQSQAPVGLVCTSGSAILNYAPAIAEAFYQKIPLVIITADRPNEWIDQGENQSIQQFEVYKNYIKKSFQLPVQIKEEKDLWYSDRIVSEAINTTVYPDFAPVHINVPLREPLYDLVATDEILPKIIEAKSSKLSLSEDDALLYASKWNQATKKLIVVGGLKNRDAKIETILNELAEDDSVIVLKESISNVYGEQFIDTIDPLIEVITQNKLVDFTPDIIITFGNGIVSKKLKFWLRNTPAKMHWHLTSNFEHWDNFQSLSDVVTTDKLPFLENLVSSDKKTASSYKYSWQNLNQVVQKSTSDYHQKIDYCDFSVFNFLVQNIPADSNLQMGNSTPIRYANLHSIAKENNWIINSNRGVSGIDGQTSTAIGASLINKEKLTFCITGDLAFMYDSNALWNNYLHPNFKLIVINNNGGNIFRIIPGPSKLDELEDFFETKNPVHVKPLAEMHNMAYFNAKNLEELSNRFESFINENNRAAVLEICTPNTLSADTLKNYFKHLVETVNL